MPDLGMGIIGTGHYIPENIQTNEELCKHLSDITPEEIILKTGIKKRHHISSGETTASMALRASSMAMSNAGVEAKDIDLIIVASFSQDYMFPPLSAKIHSALGASKSCQIIDINTTCTGLVTAITLASERMHFNTSIKNALIIGAEILSKFTDITDKDTAMFFSDGASAVILGNVTD